MSKRALPVAADDGFDDEEDGVDEQPAKLARATSAGGKGAWLGGGGPSAARQLTLRRKRRPVWEARGRRLARSRQGALLAPTQCSFRAAPLTPAAMLLSIRARAVASVKTGDKIGKAAARRPAAEDNEDTEPEDDGDEDGGPMTDARREAARALIAKQDEAEEDGFEGDAASDDDDSDGDGPRGRPYKDLRMVSREGRGLRRERLSLPLRLSRWSATPHHARAPPPPTLRRRCSPASSRASRCAICGACDRQAGRQAGMRRLCGLQRAARGS
jgi:hypothetical protein